MSIHKEIAEFQLQLAKEFPSKPLTELSDFVEKICPLGRRYSSLQVKNCNLGLTKTDERAEAKIEETIKKMAADFGFPGVELNGDPRGYTIKLVLPSGRSNNFGGTGWGVPGS